MLERLKKEENTNKEVNATSTSCHAGIFILDTQLTILSMNGLAIEMSKGESLFIINDGKLCGNSEYMRELLFDARMNASETGHLVIFKSIDKYARDCEENKVEWIMSSKILSSGPKNLILLSLKRLREHEPISGRKLITLFDLTQAEARLAVDLANGKSVSEISSSRDKNIHTLRAHMRSIYAKLGVNKQSKLAAYIWSLSSI